MSEFDPNQIQMDIREAPLVAPFQMFYEYTRQYLAGMVCLVRPWFSSPFGTPDVTVPAPLPEQPVQINKERLW